jgi:hypothetical protein
MPGSRVTQSAPAEVRDQHHKFDDQNPSHPVEFCFFSEPEQFSPLVDEISFDIPVDISTVVGEMLVRLERLVALVMDPPI